MTDPAGTVVLVAVVTVPTTRPAFVIAVVAAVCVRATTLGTATCGTPVESTSTPALPTATWLAVIGDWLLPDAARIVVLVAVVTVPTTRPAFVTAVVAA